ILLVRRMIWV
ncbi:rhs family domain protein, partial [Vibrio parahaemolyticus V-223/04]